MDEIDFERESIQMEQTMKMIPTVLISAGIGFLITIVLSLIFGEKDIFLMIPICITIPFGMIYLIVSTNRKLRQYELEKKSREKEK